MAPTSSLRWGPRSLGTPKILLEKRDAIGAGAGFGPAHMAKSEGRMRTVTVPRPGCLSAEAWRLFGAPCPRNPQRLVR